MTSPRTKKKPLVSVCIPTYNAADFIKETIGSVSNSVYSKIEIIVNDDASVDNTAEIVKNIPDKRIQLFENSINMGAPTNWNRSLKKASGEFIGLLNHDDLFGPFWITFAVHTLQKYTHIGWVASAFVILDEKGRTSRFISRFAETREYSPRESFSIIAKLDGLAPGCIFRRKILEEVGYYDEKAGPGADEDLFLRLASRYPLYFSTNRHVSRRLHAENLTYRWSSVEQIAEGFRMLNKIFNNNDLPGEIHELKESCYNHYYSKVANKARQFARQGDEETGHRIFRILLENGFRE